MACTIIRTPRAASFSVLWEHIISIHPSSNALIVSHLAKAVRIIILALTVLQDTCYIRAHVLQVVLLSTTLMIVVFVIDAMGSVKLAVVSMNVLLARLDMRTVDTAIAHAPQVPTLPSQQKNARHANLHAYNAQQVPYIAKDVSTTSTRTVGDVQPSAHLQLTLQARSALPVSFLVSNAATNSLVRNVLGVTCCT